MCFASFRIGFQCSVSVSVSFNTWFSDPIKLETTCVDRAWFSCQTFIQWHCCIHNGQWIPPPRSHRILFLSVCSSNAFAGSAFMRVHISVWHVRHQMFSLLFNAGWDSVNWFQPICNPPRTHCNCENFKWRDYIECVNNVSAENHSIERYNNQQVPLISFNGVPYICTFFNNFLLRIVFVIVNRTLSLLIASFILSLTICRLFVFFFSSKILNWLSVQDQSRVYKTSYLFYNKNSVKHLYGKKTLAIHLIHQLYSENSLFLNAFFAIKTKKRYNPIHWQSSNIDWIIQWNLIECLKKSIAVYNPT